MVKLQDFKIDCLASRFWSKIEPIHLVPFGGCWNWVGAKRLGYGSITMRLKNGTAKIMQAHRIAYLMTNGEIPNGLFVLHHCDNRLCVKPDHLFLGTNSDNMQDMIQKGRASLEHKKKLSPAQVQAIQEKYSKRASQLKIAKDEGVEQFQVSRIIRGKKVRGISESKADEIRKRYAEYSPAKITLMTLASEFGVHERTVFSIIHKRGQKNGGVSKEL